MNREVKDYFERQGNNLFFNNNYREILFQLNNVFQDLNQKFPELQFNYQAKHSEEKKSLLSFFKTKITSKLTFYLNDSDFFSVKEILVLEKPISNNPKILSLKYQLIE